MTFASLGLSAELVRSATDLGYQQPTPVQAAAIPEILRGKDVWASAKTGSGKTAAFVLPMLNPPVGRPRSPARRLRGLILVPTRELAVQTAAAIAKPGRPSVATAQDLRRGGRRFHQSADAGAARGR